MGDLSSCEYLRRWWISRGFVASENRVKIGKSENRGNRKIGESSGIGKILEIENARPRKKETARAFASKREIPSKSTLVGV